jgi:NAD(P)H dehydrogenase (quinone)
MKVLIVYYSTYGNVYKMAQLVAEGVKDIPGAEPVIRTVQELIPQVIIDARDEMKAGKAMQQGIPLVTLDDFRQAGAIAFGTPTRFGNVSAQLKNQIDQLTSLWLTGELEGKPAGIFVSTASLHGGQETTSLTLMAPLLHLGMILVGVPYTVQELFTTQGGGSPYGPGHVAGGDNRRDIDEQEATICRALGRRLADLGMRLQRT